MTSKSRWGISPITSTTTLTPATCSCMTTITTTATFSATIKTVPITTKGSPKGGSFGYNDAIFPIIEFGKISIPHSKWLQSYPKKWTYFNIS